MIILKNLIYQFNIINNIKFYMKEKIQSINIMKKIILLKKIK